MPSPFVSQVSVKTRPGNDGCDLDDGGLGPLIDFV